MRTLIAAAILCPAAALAGGYAIPNENARDLALSQAAVASQRGPEAVVMNTAALAGQEGLSVSGSVEYLDNHTKWTDGGASSSTRYHPNFPPALNVAWGGKLGNGMAYGLGVGFLVPAGGSLFWPGGWQGATRIEAVDQRVYLVRAGGALEPLPGVKVGAALIYYRVTEVLEQQLSFDNAIGHAKLGLAGGAPSFSLSGEFTVPGVPLKLGVDYRHKGNLKLTGKAHFDGVPPVFQTQGLIDQDATSYVTVPNELFLGAAYQVTQSLELMASWSMERWSVYTDDTFVGDKGLVVAVPRNYKNGWVYRLAAEYGNEPALPRTTLRAGLLRSISRPPTETLSPTLSDANSWAVSVGAGYDILPSLRADVGYQYAWFDKITATGAAAFPGSYATTAHLLSVGVSWRMPK